MRMLEQGVASAEDIDRAMELGYNHPMGPLKLTDVVGLDVRLAIAEYLYRTLESPNLCRRGFFGTRWSRVGVGRRGGRGYTSGERWAGGRVSILRDCVLPG